MKDFGTALKLAGGGEGDRCKYPYRLDTYGCGCQHDCFYCYAKSLLDFRKLWNAQKPSVGEVSKLAKELKKIPAGQVVRLGGMTDCFQPMEATHRTTYKTIRKLQSANIPYLIVTKGSLVAASEYLNLYDPELAHFQISISATDNAVSSKYEKASSVEKRIEAYKTLSELGFDVSLGVAPVIPNNVDFNALEGEKVLVEFLRVNSWIEKWLPLNYSAWTVNEGGYKHLPLEYKIKVINSIKNFEQISVCEDVNSHYEYFKNNVNFNKDDCCNLRRK